MGNQFLCHVIARAFGGDTDIGKEQAHSHTILKNTYYLALNADSHT
jgi:hypothetical protein